PVYANTTGSAYPAEAAAAKDLLGNQLAKPVEFVAQVRAMHAAGVRTFLEVGPGQTLTRLVGQIAADPAGSLSDAAAVAVDSSGGEGPGVLAWALALGGWGAGGSAVGRGGWEAGSGCRPPALREKPGLVIPIWGANYVSPRPTRAPAPPVSVLA